MNFQKRILIFSTFLLSFLSLILLLTALTTNYWVTATPKKYNQSASYGEVNYGLFFGNKDLNTGFGLRSNPVTMYTFIVSEPGSMNFWLWFFTALGTGLALLSSTVAAIAAVLKAASSGKRGGTMVILFMSNVSSAVGHILAFICWLTEFYGYLTHTVLAMEDHKQHWYSQGLAYLGFSFYLIIASVLVVFANIIILIYVKRLERRERKRFEIPNSEEKNQSAIMLY